MVQTTSQERKQNVELLVLQFWDKIANVGKDFSLPRIKDAILEASLFAWLKMSVCGASKRKSWRLCLTSHKSASSRSATSSTVLMCQCPRFGKRASSQ